MRSTLILAALCCTLIGSALADSKLLATSGLLQVEGAAGGGIVPWALIAGYGSDTEIGVAASATRVDVDDFELDVASVAVGFYNRLELSVARQTLDVQPLGLEIEQDIIGAKLRLMGDVVYTELPQISLGVQYKRNKDNTVPFLLGADDDSGTDIYLAGTKLFLDALLGRNVLLNGSLRWTDANQAGLLGFGADGDSDPELVAEASAAVFLNRYWAIGYEYRQKPDRLSSVEEQDWQDAFIAWFPNKHVAAVAAYADLGDIAGLPDQKGWYLSLQLSL